MLFWNFLSQPLKLLVLFCGKFLHRRIDFLNFRQFSVLDRLLFLQLLEIFLLLLNGQLDLIKTGIKIFVFLVKLFSEVFVRTFLCSGAVELHFYYLQFLFLMFLILLLAFHLHLLLTLFLQQLLVLLFQLCFEFLVICNSLLNLVELCLVWL